MRIRLPGFDVDKLAREAIANRCGVDISRAEITHAIMAEMEAFIDDSIADYEGSEEFHDPAEHKEAEGPE